MAYEHIKVPSNGEKITLGANHTLNVPDRPIIPFIEGDGTGPDIWRASQYVFDNAVKKIYGGKRQIAWMEVFAGEKPFNQWKNWLPDETVEAFREFLVGIKGPLTTPIGGGIRSLNVALRQMLDLYVCLRPVRYFTGVPSPVKHPEKLDVVIFRENTKTSTQESNGRRSRPRRRRSSNSCRTRWASKKSASLTPRESASSLSRAKAPSG